MSEEVPRKDVVHLSSVKYLVGCLVVAAILAWVGKSNPFPSWLLAVEVCATVIALFVFGSIRYRLDKNALTYGAVLVITATFWGGWWPDSALKATYHVEGLGAFFHFAKNHLLSLHGLDELIHADTMLFILGLTLFVSVIAQTRLLETLSFSVLKKNKGYVVPTIGILAAVVAFSSGILDGVSMIGLMIRTLVIILFLAKASDADVEYAVIVSTVVTTVCGMWLAYGEPPNLIMKANLHPHLNDAFFLRYCLPVAVGSYFIVLWNIRRRLKGKKIEIEKLDVLDLNTADVRFLQSSRHGEVLTPIEFTEDHKTELGVHMHPVVKRLHQGEPLGEALVNEGVPDAVRRQLLGKFVSEEIADALDHHYSVVLKDDALSNDESAKVIGQALASVSGIRTRTQWIGALSFVPFIGLLVWHAINHDVPLFLASFGGFAVALLGIIGIPKMWRLAMREAKHEYLEYLFLLPLFLSITLLSKSGFFDEISTLLHAAIKRFGASHVAFGQFLGTTFLSAMLDNNVVADFAGRACTRAILRPPGGREGYAWPQRGLPFNGDDKQAQAKPAHLPELSRRVAPTAVSRLRNLQEGSQGHAGGPR
jgi:Na+/H+ antiporter NhaD/arsenite permease-like protein